MATPFLKIQNVNASIYQNNIGQVRINTFDGDGAPLDVSTGFELAQVSIRITGGANPTYGSGGSGLNITAQFTATFDETGFVLSWTRANANALMSLLPAIQQRVYISLTNDSAVTRQLCAVGSLQMLNDSAVG